MLDRHLEELHSFAILINHRVRVSRLGFEALPRFLHSHLSAITFRRSQRVRIEIGKCIAGFDLLPFANFKL